MNVALAVTRSCPHCPSIEAELKKLGIPYSIRYMEDDVELQNKHNIKGSPNILVDGELVFNGIDQGMLLDASGHTKMAVGHQFHFGQHGQHSGHGKNAGQNAAGGGHYGNGHREPDTVIAQCRPGGGGKGVIPCIDDFGKRKITRNGKADQGVDHHAGRDGNHDGTTNI